jgi:hypothetical protein
MIAKIIDWFFAPSEKFIVETDDVYDKLLELEARVEVLEEENVELTNELYRIENSLDARIDILTLEKWIKKDV